MFNKSQLLAVTVLVVAYTPTFVAAAPYYRDVVELQVSLLSHSIASVPGAERDVSHRHGAALLRHAAHPLTLLLILTATFSLQARIRLDAGNRAGPQTSSFTSMLEAMPLTLIYSYNGSFSSTLDPRRVIQFTPSKYAAGFMSSTIYFILTARAECDIG